MFFKKTSQKPDSTSNREDMDGYIDIYDDFNDTTYKAVKLADNKKKTDDIGPYKRHVYWVDGGILNIKINRSVDEKFNVTTYDMQNTKMLSVAVSDDNAGLITTAKLGSMVVKLTCAHVVQLMPLDEIKEYVDINPIVYISKKAQFNTMTMDVKRGEKCEIITYDVSRQQTIMYMTCVYSVVNVMIKVKGTPKKTTLALFINLEYNDNIIWSGSIVKIGKDNIFVISSYSRLDNGLGVFVAWAPTPHEYKPRII
jgi:hypothetical protein